MSVTTIPLTTSVTERDGRVVVVKSGSGLAAQVRLSREAQWLKEISHPGVVELIAEHDGGETAELIIAYRGAQTLATAEPPLEQLARLLASLCSVVSDLHDLGVAHNRIEADHAVVTDAGHVCLCSLGSACSVTGPLAVSPEAAEDVRQLGELMVELVARHPEPAAIPSGSRWSLARRSNQDALRGCLLNIADRARADDAARRPTARQLAASVSDAAPTNGDRPSEQPARSGRLDEPYTPGRKRPARRRTARGVALSVVAITIAVILGATLVLKGLSSLGGADTYPSGTSSTDQPADGDADGDGSAPPDSATDDEPGSAAASLPPQPTPTIACAAITAGAAADVDGDGCEEGIVIDAGVVQVEEKRYQIGEAGDAVTVIDWDCDGEATPAVLRPGTGEVFVFDHWATADEEVEATLIGEAPGAVTLDVEVEGDCPVLVPRDNQGAPIPLGNAR